jgi:hypothetical protein
MGSKRKGKCARCGLSELIGSHATAEDCLNHLDPRYRMLRRDHAGMATRMDAALARAESWKLKAMAAYRRIAELEGSQSTEKRLHRLERTLAELRQHAA